jgi:hypothetical protein
MPRDGLYWYQRPGEFAQRVSAFSETLGDKAGEIGAAVTKEAVEYMQDAVKTRGVKDGQDTGGPRAKTWAMYDSIAGIEEVNSRGRYVSGWGFIRNPPSWTKYQEPGTASTGFGRGIKAMHAFADANQIAVNKLSEEFADLGGNLWSDF